MSILLLIIHCDYINIVLIFPFLIVCWITTLLFLYLFFFPLTYAILVFFYFVNLVKDYKKNYYLILIWCSITFISYKVLVKSYTFYQQYQNDIQHLFYCYYFCRKCFFIMINFVIYINFIIGNIVKLFVIIIIWKIFIFIIIIIFVIYNEFIVWNIITFIIGIIIVGNISLVLIICIT